MGVDKTQENPFMIREFLKTSVRIIPRPGAVLLAIVLLGVLATPFGNAQAPEPQPPTIVHQGGGEASLVLQDFLDFYLA